MHEVITTFSDPDQPAELDAEPEVFLVQVATLTRVTRSRRAVLREKAIVARPPDPPGSP